MSPTTSCPAHHAPPATLLPRGGSSRRHPSGSKTSPTFSPTTSRAHSTSPTAGRAHRPGSGARRHLRCGSSGLPGSGRSGSTRLQRSRASSGHSRSPRKVTPSALPRSPGSVRPLSMPDASSRRGTRSRRRSTRSGRSDDRRAAAQAMAPLNRVLAGWRIRVAGSCPRRHSRCSSRCRPALSTSRAHRSRSVRGASGPQRGRDRLRRTGTRPRPRLGLPAPARALGFRGLARGQLGDRGGMADFREAIVLATAAGQGRDVALLHNNYAIRALAGSRAPARP